MDVDELVVQAPVRPPPKFAPKNSKIKPKPKAEAALPLPSNDVKPVSIPKKEEICTSDTIEMDIDVEIGVKKEEIEDINEMDESQPIDEEPEEDEVVQEIDVWFSPSTDPTTKLFVLQYPLRPLWRPYEMEERCKAVRVKSATAQVEVDVAIDVDSKNYDSRNDLCEQSKTQTLSSIWKPTNSSDYAVGVLTGNKLSLHPVHAVVQLRPSLQHLDKKESRRKIGVSSYVEAAVKIEPQEGTSAGSSRKMGKPSVQNKDNGEDWVPLKYHGARSEEASRYLHKMVAGEGPPIEFSMNPYAYLDCLCPGSSNDLHRSESTRRRLLTLPLVDRLKKFFVEEHTQLQRSSLYRFDALKHLAPDKSVEEVLGALEEHAQLVQGLWVLKSKLVPEKENDKKFELARDYVLLLFSKNTLISNSQLPPILAKAMKEVLNGLAVERPTCNDWKLRELPDLSFVKQNPSVVKKQEEGWEAVEKKIDNFFETVAAHKKNSTSNTVNNPTVPKSSTKVITKNPKGETARSAVSEDVRDAIRKTLQKLFKSAKVCSFQQIGQRLKDMAVSESARSTGFAKEAVAAVNSINEYPNELQAILSEIAVNIHGVCVPKSSPDHPEYDSLRKVVIDLFIGEGPNGKLRKAQVVEAAKSKLNRDVPEFSKVMQELCTSSGSAWTLRRGDGNPKN